MRCYISFLLLVVLAFPSTSIFAQNTPTPNLPKWQPTPYVNHARLTIQTVDYNGWNTVTVPWNRSFPDTNYTATCSPQVSEEDDLWGFQVFSLTKDSVVIEYANYHSQQMTIHCLGIQD